MITTGNWPDALEPIARLNHDYGFDEVPAEKSMFYSVRTSKKFTETYLELGDIQAMGRFNGTMNYSDISQGYKFTASVVQYGLGIKIQRIFAETDQQDVVTGLPRKLGQSAHDRMATDVFFPLNNAFNTSITTLDGLQLCSSAHTSNNNGSNQSNRGTSPFSALIVAATRILMKRTLTNTDRRMTVNPDLLIVPEELYEAGYEVIKSNGKVDTANNNVNFHMGKYKLINSIWLDDTNNWFMADSRMMKLNWEWNDVVPLDFMQAKDFDGQTAKYADYMAYDYVNRDWRGLFGHEVA